MRILIAYDGSHSADAALDDLQRAGLPHDAEALILSVASGPDPKHFTEAYNLAEQAAEKVRACFPNWAVTCDSPWGAPARVILDVINTWKPALVIVGSHGRSPAGRVLLGSVSLEVIHKSPCSVRVVRRTAAAEGPIRIVVGHDGSAPAATAIREIARRPWPAGTEVHVVCAVETLAPAVEAVDASTFSQETAFEVIQEADKQKWTKARDVADQATKVLQNAGLTATPIVIEADPREALRREAESWGANAIFVGARGLRLMDRLLLGSVSTHVVTHSQIAVEIVHD